MERISNKIKWIVSCLVLVASIFILLHLSNDRRTFPSQTQRKAALSRADVLCLYTDMGFLEEKTGKSIEQLINEHAGSGNINSLLLQLLDENQISSKYTTRTSSYDGKTVFVDAWGAPYDIRLATNFSTVRSNLPVSDRVTIHSTNLLNK